jgi:hypothetical protein
MSVVALIGSAAGCAPAAPTGPADKPAIKSFATSPTSISQGQSTTLSWDVSGATTVTIEPAIGAVGSSGSLQLTPDTSVTYTLTATNQAGIDTKSVSIAVTPVVAGKPDLVITDVWLMASQVNYKIANLGNAESEPSHTYIYFGALDENKQTTTWIKQDSGRVEPLAAGEERMTAFPNFDWRFQSGLNPYSESDIGYDVKVCVDAENAIAESNEDNNCLIETWGQEFSYDFFKNAPLATWKSSVGATNLRWPMVTEDDNGAVVRDNFSPTLTICPEHVSNGWILGRYGEIYGEFGKTMMRPFTIPQKVKFTAKVGFAPGVKSSDGVRFALGYIDDMGSIVFFPKMDINSDGQMHDYEVDLSGIAGKKTELVILVEAKGSPEGDCVKVLEPKIVEIEQPSM